MVTLSVTAESRRNPYFDPFEPDKPVEPEVDALGPKKAQLGYDPTEWIGSFIFRATELYNKLGFFGTPEGYDLTWVMRDRESGVEFEGMGFTRDDGAFGGRKDFRKVSEVGILPDMELEPVNLPPPDITMIPPPLTYPATAPPGYEHLRTSGFEEWLGREERAGRLPRSKRLSPRHKT